jgi:CarD family transcriptional regulator
MFNKGDFIIYSGRGICRIDDICEKQQQGIMKSYYILHPVEDYKLKISISTDNDSVKMMELISEEEAEVILDSFKLPGIDWIDGDNERIEIYSDIVKTGNRKEIARIVNTLMKKKIEAEISGSRFIEKDKKLLAKIQNIFFAELAYSLNTTYEEINEKINSYINE